MYSDSSSSLCVLERLTQGKYIPVGYGFLVSPNCIWTLDLVIPATESLELYQYRAVFQSENNESSSYYSVASYKGVMGSLDISKLDAWTFENSLCSSIKNLYKNNKNQLIVNIIMLKLELDAKKSDSPAAPAVYYNKIKESLGDKEKKKRAYFHGTKNYLCNYIQIFNNNCQYFKFISHHSHNLLLPPPSPNSAKKFEDVPGIPLLGCPIFDSQMTLLGVSLGYSNKDSKSFGVGIIPHNFEEILYYSSFDYSNQENLMYQMTANHSVKELEKFSGSTSNSSLPSSYVYYDDLSYTGGENKRRPSIKAPENTSYEENFESYYAEQEEPERDDEEIVFTNNLMWKK